TIFATSATLHVRRLGVEMSISVSGIALLTPWVAIDVIAELLPEARPIVCYELKAPHPLCTLPEIKMRDQKPRRTTMFRSEWLAFIACRDHRLASDQVLNWNIGAVVTVTVDHREGCRRLR